MGDEEKHQRVEISWLDFVDYADPTENDASLFKPISGSESVDLEGAKEPLGPNLANSAMFVLLSENSSDPHFIKDSTLKYIYVNKAMEELLQRPRKEIIGKTDRDLFRSSEVGTMNYATCRSLQGRIVREKNVRNIGDVPRTFLDTLVPWRNDLGQIVAIYGISVDVTDREATLLSFEIDEIECRSQAMRSTLTQAQLVAKVDTTVLMTGESGSGKDFLARYIHDHSDRRDGPFESINCAALPRELVESELFGHEKGAFSGADRRKRGRVELADTGTLFLNEIGELAVDLQSKLLSFLDKNSFSRVGSEDKLKVDVRILTATNRNLEQEIEAKTFRFDLYHRINVWPIRVPPLRERMEDLPKLTNDLLKELVKELKIEEPMPVTASLVTALGAYHWPGNVRELRNILERALIVAKGNGVPLSTSCLQIPVIPGKGKEPGASVSVGEPVQPLGPQQTTDVGKALSKRPEKPSDKEVRKLFQDYIVDKGWTRADLARDLRVHESTLKKWFKAAGCPAGTRGRPRKSAPLKAEESNETSSVPSTE